MRRAAEFCMDCRVGIAEVGELGNNTGAANMRMGLISLWWAELGAKYFFLYLNTKYMLKMYLNTK